MNIQVILVTLIVTSAIIYLARNIYSSAKGNACESGKCGCDSKPNNNLSAPHTKQH